MSDPFDSMRIRPGEPGDFARVRKDWLLSYCTSQFAHYLTTSEDWWKRASQLYWDWQKEVIERLLRDAELWVACWSEAPTAILGWCVTEPARDGRPFVVHFVAVDPRYRAHHVAQKLLAPAFEQRDVVYTHRTRVCRHLPIPPGWTYDPRPALMPRAKAATS